MYIIYYDMIKLYHFTDKNTLVKNSETNKSETNKDDMLQNEEFESIAGPSNRMPIVEDMNEYELNDSDDDINMPIHDFSFITSDANKNAFDSDRESEIDINESLASLDKSSKNITNPALVYLSEYSGLSQNQIMHLMKYNKDQSRKTKTTGKDVKMHEKNTNSELIEDKNPTIAKSVSFPENHMEVSNSIESQNMQNACTINNITIELISSNMESDNFIKEELLKNNTEALDVVTSNVTSSDKSMKFEKRAFSPTKSNDNTTVKLISPNVKSDKEKSLKNNAETLDVTSNITISIDKSRRSEEHSSPTKSNDNMNVKLISTVQTDTSDSDDFIEIQDIPIPDVEILQKNITKKENVEITFKPDEKLEDDIFADIFEKNKNKDLLTSLEQTQSVNENDKHRMPLISEDNNLKTNLLDTIPEEMIVEKAEIKSLENTQLIENISIDEDKMHDSQDSNNLIEKTNTNLLTQDDICNEYIQEKRTVLPTNEEDLTELKVYIFNIISVNKLIFFFNF